MLRATSTRQGLFTVGYDVRVDGRRVTGWTARTWQQQRALTIDGQPYVLRAEGITRFHLEGEHRARAARSADGPPARRHWNVTSDDVRYRLAGSGMGRRFSLLTGEDAVNEAGRIWRSGSLRPSYAAELPGALPIPVQVFLLWVAMAVWRSSAAAAGAASLTGTVG